MVSNYLITRKVRSGMPTHSHDSMTWEQWRKTLSRTEQWEHCGSQIPHEQHPHDIVFIEGTYSGICVGTPQCVVHSTSSPSLPTSSPITRPSWDDYFLSLLPALARRSTCDRGRSAAIFVRDNDQIASGYVGSPPDMPHCDDVGHLWDTTSTHCLRTIHAEQNAMIRALRHGISLRDTTVYCTMTPCFTCAKLMVGLGVYRVVASHQYHDDVYTRTLFADANVALVIVTNERLYEPRPPVPVYNGTFNLVDTVDDNDSNNDDNDYSDLICPTHKVMFSLIEKSINGRRVCPYGDTWISQHGILINIDALECG